MVKHKAWQGGAQAGFQPLLAPSVGALLSMQSAQLSEVALPTNISPILTSTRLPGCNISPGWHRKGEGDNRPHKSHQGYMYNNVTKKCHIARALRTWADTVTPTQMVPA